MSANAVKAVLFDCDGTLVDTLEDIAGAVNTVLAQNGYLVHPVDAYRRFVGNGARRLVALASGAEEDAEINRLLALFTEVYDRRCLDNSRPYPGAVQAVHNLREAGISLAVITNKPQRQAQKIIFRFFPGCFESVRGGLPDTPKKPDPQAVLPVLQALDVTPPQAVIIGDSDVDVQTAKAIGSPFIGVPFGFRGESELRSAGARVMLRSFRDLPALIFRQGGCDNENFIPGRQPNRV